MGQHKTNLKAQLAAADMLPPKKKVLSKTELRREVNLELEQLLIGHLLQRINTGGSYGA